MNDLDIMRRLNRESTLAGKMKILLNKLDLSSPRDRDAFSNVVMDAARSVDAERAQLEKDAAVVVGPLHLAMEAAKQYRFHPMGATFANGHWTVQFVALPPSSNQLTEGEPTNDQ